MTDLFDVSVVIGFRDWGLQRIRLAAESIMDSFGEYRGEVIISDFGSEDHESNRAMAEDLGCKYVFTPEAKFWSRSRALNAGFAVAEGSLLVSTDADMIFSPRSFARIVEIAQQDPRAAFFLQCRDLPQGMDHEWTAENSQEWAAMERHARLRPRWGMGGMMAIPRTGFNAIRGFDERLHTYGGEDLDFAQRARRAGYKTVWINDPDVRMYHMWHPPTISTVDKTEAGRKAVKFNQNIVYHDPSFVRNYTEWTYRGDNVDPLVTVAICTHNRANLLKESIKSVLMQSVQDFEIVVIDDGGSDHTQEAVESFNDPRIRYFWQEQGGISNARNFAAKVSRGLYTAVLDDDDLMHPKRLEWHISALEPGTAGNVGSFMNFDDESGELKLSISKIPTVGTAMEKGTAPGHSTWFIRTDVIRRIGYDETLTSGVDNSIMLRMLRAGVKITHTGKPTTLRRMHPGQVTVTDKDNQVAAASSTLKFLQWGLTAAEIAEISKAAQPGQYPPNDGRENMIEEVRPYLPDHLVRRDLLSVGSSSRHAVRSVNWDGRLSSSSISLSEGDEVNTIELHVIRDASYDDMVRARSVGLDFTGLTIVDSADDAEGAEDPLAGELQFTIRKACELANVEETENHYVAVRRVANEDGDVGSWQLRTGGEEEILELVNNEPGWAVFGNEHIRVEEQ